MRFIIKVFADSYAEFRPQYSLFFTVSVVVFVYEAICKSFKNGMSGLSDTAVTVVSAYVLSGIIVKVTESFAEKFLQLSGFITSTSAVCLTSMMSSASASSAAVLGTVCSVLTLVFNSVCSSLIIPFVCVYLTVNLCGGITGDFNVTSVSAFIRNISFGVSAFILSLFSSVLSVQSVISMGNDSLLKKTLKNVLSTGLPVLGGAVSEGVDVFMLSANEVKNSIGSVGITVTVLYSLYPICEVLLCFISVSVLCFGLSFFEESSVRNFLSSVRDVLSVILCICISLTVMAVLMFYFIIKVV